MLASSLPFLTTSETTEHVAIIPASLFKLATANACNGSNTTTSGLCFFTSA